MTENLFCGVLDTRLDELGMSKPFYNGCSDPRRYGSVPPTGFGRGFARAVGELTGMTDVRDVVPFPRTPAARISSGPFRATLGLPS